MKSGLQGVIAAIATPIGDTGEPDRERFLRLAKLLLEGGCDGLNVLGTTGEATSFTAEQRKSLMSSVAKSDLPMSRLMVGTGAAAVGDAVGLTKHAAASGFAGALILPPFYYKNVSTDGIKFYFDAIVNATKDNSIPIYLYNFPLMTGIIYSQELVIDLIGAFGDRIVGLKDSSGDLPYARSLAKELPGFKIFPSDEATLLEARTGIFAGCISATANLNAAYCSAAYHKGDSQGHDIAVRIRSIFSGKPLVQGVKAMLGHIHSDEKLARTLPPLAPLGAEVMTELVDRYRTIVDQ
jgi:4-hydroxy-tetrahydrodipicolinate synthase